MKKMKQMFSGSGKKKEPAGSKKKDDSSSSSKPGPRRVQRQGTGIVKNSDVGGKTSNSSANTTTKTKTNTSSTTSSLPSNSSSSATTNSSGVDDPPAQTTTPRADVTLPDRPLTDRRRVGSRQAQRDNLANHFPVLPKLMSVTLKERPALFIQKLKMCEQGFTFTGDIPDSVSKDMHTKRQTLLELVDYVNTAQQVAEVFTDEIQACVVRMVSANIFRSLPAMEQGYDAEQDEPTYEASWPHLQVVYEFLLRFVISNQVSSKSAKKHINHQFCSSLVELFDSEGEEEVDNVLIFF